MMPSIMSGSLIRETPPWARMSAGTRSRAMTATAPASSAILACSALTTSMMTPPLSISAMPRLTRVVPVAGWVAAVAASADMAGLLQISTGRSAGIALRSHASWCARRSRPRSRRSASGLPTAARRRTRRSAAARRGPPAGTHRTTALRRTRCTSRDGVVVEPAGQLHPQAGRLDARQGSAGGHPVGSRRSWSTTGPVSADLQGRGQVALDHLAPAEVLALEEVVADPPVVGLERLRGGVGEEQRAGRVEGPALASSSGGLGPAHELGVERRQARPRPGRAAGRAAPRCRTGTTRRRCRTMTTTIATTSGRPSAASPSATARAAAGSTGCRRLMSARTRRGAVGDRLVDRHDLRRPRPTSRRRRARRIPAATQRGPRLRGSRRAARRRSAARSAVSSLRNSGAGAPPSSTRSERRQVAGDDRGAGAHRLDEHDAEALAAGVRRDVERRPRPAARPCRRR